MGGRAAPGASPPCLAQHSGICSPASHDRALLLPAWRSQCKRDGGPATKSPFSTAHPCLQRADLAAIVAGYLSGVVAGAPVEAIVDYYLAAKAEAVSTGATGSDARSCFRARRCQRCACQRHVATRDGHMA